MTRFGTTRRGLALAAGAVLLAGCSLVGAGKGSVGDLPESIGTLLLRDQACESAFAGDADTLAKCLENADQRALVTAELSEHVSAAYGGADAKVADYADAKLTTFVLGVVVASETPGLWSEFDTDSGEERTGVHRLEYVESVGAVECAVRSVLTVPLDSDVGPQDYAITMCQRSEGGVTAQIRLAGGAALDEVSLQTAAGWTNALYDGATG